MEQLVVDVSDLEEVVVLDELVFFGRQGNEKMSFGEFIQKAGFFMWAGHMASFSEWRIIREYIPEIFSGDYSSGRPGDS
jgi:hypothetical protein